MVQNKTEWIISNTAKSNSTNLSFPSPGSHFALAEEEKRVGREGRTRGGENRERQLETSAYIKDSISEKLHELLCIADAELLFSVKLMTYKTS